MKERKSSRKHRKTRSTLSSLQDNFFETGSTQVLWRSLQRESCKVQRPPRETSRTKPTFKCPHSALPQPVRRSCLYQRDRDKTRYKFAMQVVSTQRQSLDEPGTGPRRHRQKGVQALREGGHEGGSDQICARVE